MAVVTHTVNIPLSVIIPIINKHCREYPEFSTANAEVASMPEGAEITDVDDDGHSVKITFRWPIELEQATC